MQGGLPQHTPLFDAVPRQAQGVARAINRQGEFLEQKGQAANMVFMPVGQHDAAQLVLDRPQVAEIRQDQVNAGVFHGIGKTDATVDDDDIVFVFNKGEIFAYFTKAAQWKDGKRRAHGFPDFSFLFTMIYQEIITQGVSPEIEKSGQVKPDFPYF